MKEAKTKPSAASVEQHVASIPDEQQRTDVSAILAMLRRVTRTEPIMWGPSIIGFGTRHYKYDSGREGDICLIGLSARKQNISLYLPGGQEFYSLELKRLGKHATGKGCLYIKRLADVDLSVLKTMFEKGWKTG